MLLEKKQDSKLKLLFFSARTIPIFLILGRQSGQRTADYVPVAQRPGWGWPSRIEQVIVQCSPQRAGRGLAPSRRWHPSWKNKTSSQVQQLKRLGKHQFRLEKRNFSLRRWTTWLRKAPNPFWTAKVSRKWNYGRAKTWLPLCCKRKTIGKMSITISFWKLINVIWSQFTFSHEYK